MKKYTVSPRSGKHTCGCLHYFPKQREKVFPFDHKHPISYHSIKNSYVYNWEKSTVISSSQLTNA